MIDAVPHTLVPYGWDDRVAALFSYEASPDAIAGRVIRVDRDRVTVITDSDDHRVARGDPLPSVGDWVGLSEGGPDGDLLVTSVLTRRSVLGRRSVGKAPDGQVMAANVDLVFVVVGADRVMLNRVERELVAAWDSGALPVVVLTKADLVDDPVEIATELAARSRGVDVIATSAVTGLGIDEVVTLPQPNRTVVLLGASGVGKSTLANALLGEEVLATGAVRGSDNRGRHTTTARSIVTLPRRRADRHAGHPYAGSPRLRRGPVPRVPDIEEVSVRCKFRDCTHATEPGCAVRAAVASGEIDPNRMRSYEKLQKELRTQTGSATRSPCERRCASGVRSTSPSSTSPRSADLSQPPPDIRQMGMNAHADIVVIGGGLAGLVAAARASEPGGGSALRVVLVEGAQPEGAPAPTNATGIASTKARTPSTSKGPGARSCSASASIPMVALPR